MFVIYVDGASFNNPGHSGIGVAIYKDGKLLREISEYVGEGTNNVAEYKAAIRGLEAAHEMKEKEVTLRSDSQLFINQLQGTYRVKALHLKELNKRVVALCNGIKVHFEHIPREKNEVADALSKKGAMKESSEKGR